MNNLYKLSRRGEELVLALPDRDKVAALKRKWAREDRKKKSRRPSNSKGEK